MNAWTLLQHLEILDVRDVKVIYRNERVVVGIELTESNPDNPDEVVLYCGNNPDGIIFNDYESLNENVFDVFECKYIQKQDEQEFVNKKKEEQDKYGF